MNAKLASVFGQQDPSAPGRWGPHQVASIKVPLASNSKELDSGRSVRSNGQAMVSAT
ncbi:hypothetical protein M2336_000747 [Sphingobium sp. B1D7B]|nr:hypothetical protein [Sphingobium sp. B11D3A]MCW2404118.1 hypothetical protein [Sphingobium sp. B1D7B]